MHFKYLFLFICLVYCRPNLHQFYNEGFNDRDESVSSGVESVWVVYNQTTKKLVIVDKLVKPYVAVAQFKDTMTTIGWSLLKVSTNGSYPDMQQAEAAGMAEGFITANFIQMEYTNTIASYCNDEKEFCERLDTFLTTNLKWINTQIKANPKSNYWYQMSLIYKQLEGMFNGYVARQLEAKITYLQFRYFQIGGDLEDLEVALGKKNLNRVVGDGSCSAIIKLFPKNADIAISQVTWGDYVNMLRIYKYYSLAFHNIDDGKAINGVTQSFSSYPGVIYSGDDFYILSSGMVSQETTIGNSNKDLYKYIKPTSVLEWARTVLSNRLASNGNEWCSIFEKSNSGTYNNQWMILDYKLFRAGQAIQPDTLWILEQLPGTVHMADMSIVLEQQGYWASYNLPFFQFVYNISGVSADKKKYGSWFDYTMNPRSQIFHRDHAKVVDMQSLVKLMRYNDYQHDPLAKCNCTPPYSAENAISSRNDLNPASGTYPFGALGHRRHGGTDVKATNSLMSRKLSQFIAAGPTFDNQPPFQWSKTEWPKPQGHPDIFKFEPLLLDWSSQGWIVEPDYQYHSSP